MTLREVMPEGDGCYVLEVFGKGSKCPDLDDDVTMKPRCRKYNVGLGWNVSGRILKCSACLKEVE